MHDTNAIKENEVLETCHLITNRTMEYLEDFSNTLKEFDTKCSLLNSESKTFNTCLTDLEEKQRKDIEDLRKSVSKNKNFLDTNKEETEQMQTIERKLINDITKKEEKIKAIKDKLEEITKKTEKLQSSRDEIQICKLLTNTSFTYKGSNISGYVVSPNASIQCFDFNPDTMAKEDIINSLYKKIKEVSPAVKE